MRQFNYFLIFLSSICSFALSLEPVLVVLGPPGSGKGTFSQYLKYNYQYKHLSAGDLVRREIDKKTPIGVQIADIVARGEYIDTEIMQTLILDQIRQCKHEEKCIIDGFGRTQREIECLYQILADLDLLLKTRVLFFEASDAVCYERMSHRLLCSNCERIYNDVSCKPKVEGICDSCLFPLKKRFNDTPAVIEKKVRDYREVVEAHYKRSLDLFPYLFIDADRDLEYCLRYYKSLVEDSHEF